MAELPSRFTGLQVGGVALVALAAGVIASFMGSISVHNGGAIDFRGSDAQIAISGSTVIRAFDYPMIATGGVATYDAALITNNSGHSGSLISLEYDNTTNPNSTSFDCSFVTAIHTATGAPLIWNNLSTATGAATTASGVSALRWNGGQFIKCGSLKNPTTSFSGRIRGLYFVNTR